MGNYISESPNVPPDITVDLRKCLIVLEDLPKRPGDARSSDMSLTWTNYKSENVVGASSCRLLGHRCLPWNRMGFPIGAKECHQRGTRGGHLWKLAKGTRKPSHIGHWCDLLRVPLIAITSGLRTDSASLNQPRSSSKYGLTSSQSRSPATANICLWFPLQK